MRKYFMYTRFHGRDIATRQPGFSFVSRRSKFIEKVGKEMIDDRRVGRYKPHIPAISIEDLQYIVPCEPFLSSRIDPEKAFCLTFNRFDLYSHLGDGRYFTSYRYHLLPRNHP